MESFFVYIITALLLFVKYFYNNPFLFSFFVLFADLKTFLLNYGRIFSNIKI